MKLANLMSEPIFKYVPFAVSFSSFFLCAISAQYFHTGKYDVSNSINPNFISLLIVVRCFPNISPI